MKEEVTNVVAGIETKQEPLRKRKMARRKVVNTILTKKSKTVKEGKDTDPDKKIVAEPSSSAKKKKGQADVKTVKTFSQNVKEGKDTAPDKKVVDDPSSSANKKKGKDDKKKIKTFKEACECSGKGKKPSLDDELDDKDTKGQATTKVVKKGVKEIFLSKSGFALIMGEGGSRKKRGIVRRIKGGKRTKKKEFEAGKDSKWTKGGKRKLRGTAKRKKKLAGVRGRTYIKAHRGKANVSRSKSLKKRVASW